LRIRITRELPIGAEAARLLEMVGRVEAVCDAIKSIDLVQPRDHTSDYDRVIMMLEMSVDDTIVLDANEFDQYVRDVWAWTHYDATTLGEYAVGTPVYRKPKRNWDQEEEED
jgi:hypothetical protein